MPTLSPILEIKTTFSGGEKRFSCTQLHKTDNHLVVLFVSPSEMNVSGICLPAGTVTFGHFWTDRPYNVYHWLAPDSGEALGYYFNIAEATDWQDGVLRWRDLIVDVLVSPDGRLTVLDEDELPADLDSSHALQIRSGRDRVVHDVQPGPATLLDELARFKNSLWPLFVSSRSGQVQP